MRIKGFSLIELLVVVAIIALLSAVAIPYYKNYTMKAQVIQVFQKVQVVAQQAATYYLRKGVYANIDDLGYSLDSGSHGGNNGTYALNDSLITGIFVSGSGVCAAAVNYPCVYALYDGSKVGFASPDNVIKNIVIGLNLTGNTTNLVCATENATVSTSTPSTYLPKGCQRCATGSPPAGCVTS